MVKHEIEHRFNLQLPDDLVSLLSKNAADYSDELNIALGDNAGFERKPSGIALEHAARLCGVEPFRFSTNYLHKVVSRQTSQGRPAGLGSKTLD